MILTFVNAGTSNSSSVIDYLFSAKDANGTLRNPPAELLEGDVLLTSHLIDSNNRKFRYSSLAISFRNSEKPTDEELRNVIASFRETFCPNLGPEKANLLVVKHQDKGNVELHIIVNTVCMVGRRLKSFNIAPPGRHNQQLQRDFSALWNHKLGYEQIVENPFKASFSKFDTEVADGQKNKERKEKLSSICAEQILSGKINNRSELSKFLKNKGCIITRSGQDYLSIKFPNKDKAIRFKGGCFVQDADYRVLIAKHNTESKQLTKLKYEKLIQRMDTSIDYRRKFNDKAYTAKPMISVPKLVRTKEVKMLPKSKGNHRTSAQLGTVEPKAQARPIQASEPSLKNFKSLGKSSVSTSATPTSGGGAMSNSMASYGSLEAQITALGTQLNQVPPEQRPAIEKQIALLKAQMVRLAYQIQYQKKKEQNRNSQF